MVFWMILLSVLLTIASAFFFSHCVSLMFSYCGPAFFLGIASAFFFLFGYYVSFINL